MDNSYCRLRDKKEGPCMFCITANNWFSIIISVANMSNFCHGFPQFLKANTGHSHLAS